MPWHESCEPLTVSDSFSRYLIGLSAETSTAGRAARPVFEQAFAEYGLPEVIRTDSNPPFATAGVTGLTAVRWITLPHGRGCAASLSAGPPPKGRTKSMACPEVCLVGPRRERERSFRFPDETGPPAASDPPVKETDG
jgi:hypothetical protein